MKINNLRLSVIVIVLLVLLGGAVMAQSEDWIQINGELSLMAEHPRIFINPGNIDEIRCRVGVISQPECNTLGYGGQWQSHLQEYNDIKTYAADYWSSEDILSTNYFNSGRIALPSAFVYLIEGGTEYLDKSKAFLDSIEPLGGDDKLHYGFMLSNIAYDWIYNGLNESERRNYAADLYDAAISSNFYPQYNSFDPYYSAAKYMGPIFAFTGQAIYNEFPDHSGEFITRGFAAFNKISKIRARVSGDGYPYPIGRNGYYDETGVIPMLLFFSGFKYGGLNVSSIDGISRSYVGNTAFGEIYASIMNNYLINHDDAQNARNLPLKRARVDMGIFFSSMIAKEFEGDARGKITNYLQEKNPVPTTEGNVGVYRNIGNIIFNNKTANDYTDVFDNLPLTRYFINDSVVVYRSGWTGLTSAIDDAKEVYADFYAPHHVNGHTHYGKGHFDIWRGYDPLAIDSGTYPTYSWDEHALYFTNSLAHNVMMIRNPDEDSGSRPNDGGQLMNDGEGNINNPEQATHDSDCWAKGDHTMPGGCCYIGKISRFDSNDDYFYSYLNYPRAYSQSKIDNISRAFVRLGDFFVVYDRVDADDAGFVKRWLLHSIEIPTIEDSGSWDSGTPLDINGATPNQISSDTKELSISYGSSKLYVNNLLPANTQIHRVGGQGYEWYSYYENNNYDDGLEQIYPELGMWRIEVESTENREYDTFLNVLYPTDINEDNINCNLLSGSNMHGVLINDSYAVLFAKNESSILDEVIELPSNGDLNLLVTDLLPNTDYDVELNDNILLVNMAAGSYRSSDAGSIWMTINSDSIENPDANKDGKVDMKELIAHMGRWKRGEVDMLRLMAAIGRWFRGE